MAEKKEADAEKSGSKKKLFIIIGAALVVLLIGGGFATWWLVLRDKPDADEEKDPAQQVTVPVVGQPATIGPMVNIEEFIVNIISGDAAHYVKASLTVELNNELVKTEVEQRMPQMRDAILLLIGNKTYEELQDLQGKKQLKAELLSTVNSFLQSGQVVSIYFTNFVVQ